jgi:hypothetical protein
MQAAMRKTVILSHPYPAGAWPERGSVDAVSTDAASADAAIVQGSPDYAE